MLGTVTSQGGKRIVPGVARITKEKMVWIKGGDPVREKVRVARGGREERKTLEGAGGPGRKK